MQATVCGTTTRQLNSRKQYTLTFLALPSETKPKRTRREKSVQSLLLVKPSLPGFASDL